jgi:hypothetical protein
MTPSRCGDWITGLLDDVCPLGRGLLAMLRIYLDRGQKADQFDDVVTVAAAIFDSEDYWRFVEPWNAMLAEWPARGFHAKDFYPGAREFWRSDEDGRLDQRRKSLFDLHARKFPIMAGERASGLIALGFRPREYLQVASPEFKASYGTSVHSMATQIILLMLGWWAKERKYDGGFAGFMEQGDPDQAEVMTTVRNMQRDEIVGPHIQLTSFTTIEKNKARGLEAADLFAWHCNKYYMDKMRVGRNDEPRKDLMALVKAAEDRAYFSIITGDALRHFLSGSPLRDGALAEPFRSRSSLPPAHGEGRS